MLSIFGNTVALESSDSIDGNVVNSVNGYSNAGLLESAMEEHNELEKLGKGVDELADAETKLTDIVDVVTESFKEGGLTPEGLKYLKIAFKNIVGKNLANKNMPATESHDITHPIQITAIALEGVTDTIKQFWTAIKNQIGKFWNQTKTWFIKTFDIANKIISRAKNLDDKASNLTTTPAEKSFELGGASLISVNYQVKDPSVLINSFNNVKALIDGGLDNVTKENQSNKTETVLNYSNKLLTLARSAGTNSANGKTTTPQENEALDKALELNIQTTYDAITKFTKDPVNDQEMRKKLGLSDQQIASASPILPGDKKLYFIRLPTQNSPNYSDPNFISVLTETLKSNRFVLSEASAKPRELEDNLEVKVLNSAQLQQIASISSDVGETILKYKKEFEARDKYFNGIIKGFDSIIKELDGTEVKTPTQQPTQQPQQTQQQQPPVNQNGGGNGQAATTAQADGSDSDTDNLGKPVSSVDKDVRKLANSILQMFKKEISLSGSIITYAVKTTNVYLTYGERSLAQYSG